MKVLQVHLLLHLDLRNDHFLKGLKTFDLKSVLAFPWKCFMFWLSNFRDVNSASFSFSSMIIFKN